jgi:methyltransferase family protein
MVSKGVCLNVGCGLSAHPDWRNIDASPSLMISRTPLLGTMLRRTGLIPRWPHNVHYGNVLRLRSLPPGSCELVFASHVLEHLSYADVGTALKRIHLLLRGGGILRLLTPDLRHYVEAYLADVGSGDDERVARGAGHFMRDSGLGMEESRTGLRCRIREALANSRHQWIWDKPSLVAQLQEVGFVDILERGHGESLDARFFQVEDPSRHAQSFCLECRKQI